MSDCNHDCENCSSKGECGEIQKAQLNKDSHINKIIAVLSGKGGVGKSFVTSTLAVALAKKGYKVGIMDADITGPSIPKAFNITSKAEGDGVYIFTAQSTKYKIKIISSDMLLNDSTEPIVWRGPLLGGLVKQFYEDVLWEELDYLLIDMPPGTGDVALTTFQLLPVDELVIVTSPQDLVSAIVTKAIKMANMMNIKILGVIENMSYVLCPDCHKHIELFGKSNLEKIAKELDINIIAKLPISATNVALVDQGKVEDVEMKELDNVVERIEKL